MTAPSILASPPAGDPGLTWPNKAFPHAVAMPAVRTLECYAGVHADHQRAAGSLYWGDNLDVLAHLLAAGRREQIRLIYIDPPYDSNRTYARKVRLRNRQATVLTQQIQYRDQWASGHYLQFMYERLLFLRDLLAPDGAIWLHCDYRQVHRLHLLLEEVFGRDNYLNTIAWRSQVTRGAKVDAFYFSNSTQYIEIFGKNRRAPTRWHPQRKQLEFTRRQAQSQFMEDEGGFFRTSDPGTYSFASLLTLHAEGRLYAPYGGEIVIDEGAQRVYASKGGNIGVKYYLTRLDNNRFAVERGVDNLWDDIPGLGTTPGEDVGYPTQKTQALLRRIIGASTDPDDWVLDAFAGSGTTPLVAQEMGRHWLACDENYGAIQAMRRRLQAKGDTRFRIEAVGQADPDSPTTPQESARVDLKIHRLAHDRATIQVTVEDARVPAVAKLLAGRTLGPMENWREAIDSIEIDPRFDGVVFQPCLVDIPRAKREQVTGHYTLPAPPDSTEVAVRLTDVLGNETVVINRVE